MKPKILVMDIETRPLLASVWQLWENNVPLNMLERDWAVLSWAAKWVGSKKVFQKDQRRAKNVDNDKAILAEMWKLLDEADIVVTQNGKSFDVKKLNARFVIHGMKPPSSFKQIDTKLLAKKHFAFTSNSLEYMSDKLCVKYKKLKHKKFPGFELWSECLKGNQAAWREMARYNVHDVLATEELYGKLIPWDNAVNFNVYGDEPACSCGSKEFKRNGFFYGSTGRSQRYSCKSCGSEFRETKTEKTTGMVGTKR